MNTRPGRIGRRREGGLAAPGTRRGAAPVGRLVRAASLCLAAGLGLLGLASPARADRALVVALDTYQDARLSFRLAGASAADAARIQGMLTGALGYGGGDIKVLRDGAATKAAVLDGLRTWLGGAKPGERVFFYYAGQGYFSRQDGKARQALLPFDVVPKGSGTDLSFGGMLTADEMDAAFAALAGRHVTAVIDSSQSGTVTRAITVEAASGGGNPAARSPQIEGTTRSIVVEAAVAEEKQAAADPPPPPAGIDLVTWSAVSPTQLALIDEDAGPDYHGVFTAAFADGIEKGLADLNHDGVISNQELLDYVRERSADYCGRHAGRCEMGLTPGLAGEGAALKVAARNPVTGTAPPDLQAGDALNTGKITPQKVMDILGARPSDDVRLEQIPRSPVRLGTQDIRFRVTSGHDGFLVLLSVSDEGEVVQLFPNAISDKRAKDGRILAGHAVTVPDPSYGMRFDATSVTKGTVLALVAVDPLKLSRKFVTRQIQVIPQDEVNASLLPELAQSLATPAGAETVQENTKPVGRSLATLPYEIIP
ncbi:DUF4384 domain-containing protein [Labrys wisconsinensis]|uniref:DUF4384 domain-containing protein n=1 Tax=Labrys wisconsinensis TaxID=425677 RepID=A0ABU0JE65_9HYPH|nr:DUF4384 domain-containing protein [Labrys wisconsinensis]MDQ0472569.1 hypothetical protein [Labrys wisconsinensis]